MAGDDRRVRRTRRLLTEAFIALVLETGYERITVQDILDRADIGRSTFYAHFRDKQALLEACFDDMRDQFQTALETMKPEVPSDPAGPASVLFAHAYQHRNVYEALCGKQGGTVVHRYLHRLIGDLLREHLRPHLAAADSGLPADMVAEYYTSATLGLLIWWIDQGFRFGPARMAAMHHHLAAPGVMAALTAASPRREPLPSR